MTSSQPPHRARRTPISARPTLFCFSHLRWNFVFQRPQHLLTRAAREFRVLFIEEPVRANVAACEMRCAFDRSGVEVLTPVLPLDLAEGGDTLSRLREMLEPYRASAQGSRMIGWYYTPMAREFSDRWDFDVIVYDCMDELSCFKNPPARLKEVEKKLLSEADVVFTGGLALYEAKRLFHDNVHAVPSSIDAQHFRPARSSRSEPPELCALAHPRIGYFGVIDERLDLDLVLRIAEERPQWTLVMIGPVAKIDEGTLPRRSNILWLGAKSYEELPRYLGALDAGWMPFAMNDATRFISPTKTPEFLAAGLPVASTPVLDVVRAYGERGLVEIAASADEMVNRIAGLLGQDGATRKRWLGRVDRHLASMSWDATWSMMLCEVARLLKHDRDLGSPIGAGTGAGTERLPVSSCSTG